MPTQERRTILSPSLDVERELEGRVVVGRELRIVVEGDVAGAKVQRLRPSAGRGDVVIDPPRLELGASVAQALDQPIERRVARLKVVGRPEQRQHAPRLLDQVGPEHSMGGKVAQLLASRRPEGLAALALVASAPPSPLALPAQAREMMATAYETRGSVEATIDQVLTAKPLAPADREQVIVDSLRGAPQAKRAWPAAASREDIGDAVAAIDVPALVIAGKLDRIDTLEAVRTGLIPRLS